MITNIYGIGTACPLPNLIAACCKICFASKRNHSELLGPHADCNDAKISGTVELVIAADRQMYFTRAEGQMYFTRAEQE